MTRNGARKFADQRPDEVQRERFGRRVAVPALGSEIQDPVHEFVETILKIGLLGDVPGEFLTGDLREFPRHGQFTPGATSA